ncbi:hypothetical protein CMU07_09135 [Elizabethkingia anophelis]|nr:hypothetical protein [Elizabethkingia anophelis]
MNLVDCYVTEVIRLNHNTTLNKWVVEVQYGSYGRIDTTMLLFNTEEEAKSVKIGYKFLA